MRNAGRLSLLASFSFLFVHQSVLGQMAGSRAQEMSVSNDIALLSEAVVNSHIAIGGNAQKRVTPTSMRLIWAVATEAKEAAVCRELAQKQIDKSIDAWKSMGISSKSIVEDFVSAIPRFEYTYKELDGERVMLEQQTGYRLQTNLHVAVSSDAQAMGVIDSGIKSGLTDLIGVDYSAELEEVQRETTKEALDAAKAKSKVLLELFAEAPMPINVQEQTKVFFPEQLYDSFENVSEQSSISYSREFRRIEAFHPKNTYYKGLTRSADLKSYELPMHPEIIIESRVVIYYRSPDSRTKSVSMDAKK